MSSYSNHGTQNFLHWFSFNSCLSSQHIYSHICTHTQQIGYNVVRFCRYIANKKQDFCFAYKVWILNCRQEYVKRSNLSVQIMLKTSRISFCMTAWLDGYRLHILFNKHCNHLNQGCLFSWLFLIC